MSLPPIGLPTTFRDPFAERPGARETRAGRREERPARQAIRAAVFWIIGRDQADDRSRLLLLLSGACLALATSVRVYFIVLDDAVLDVTACTDSANCGAARGKATA